MKKSNFLRASKDALTRSFNSAKCKTSLKLASSRLKLLRNKKEVAVKQMKREIAQLLESGQDQTARIRVEHVIREEKMMAAFDLIAIFCELIVARMPIIESQKNCPIDLKEAITSVIFASPRCGDVPELMDVRKLFTAKYGKEFVSAAVELRPECGVSRMLVEKLSAVAPNGQTKIKILSAIAEEHNIKWDPKSFGENDSVPPNDLLNGPSTFQRTDEMQARPPRFESSDNRTAPSHYQMPNSVSSFPEQNVISSHGTQNYASEHTDGNPYGSAARSEVRPSGALSGRTEARQSSSGDDSLPFGSRQNWNMEFKDATSAAQAAAESAERASFAARAAAELSTQGWITRQSSIESHKSDIHVASGKLPRKYDNSSSTNEDSKDSFNDFDRNHKSESEQYSRVQLDNSQRSARKSYQDHHETTEAQGSASERSRSSIDDNSFAHGRDGFTQSSSRGHTSGSGLSMKDQYDRTGSAHTSGLQDDIRSQKFNYFANETTKNEHSANSPPSYSRTFGDEENVSSSDDREFRHDSEESLPSVAGIGTEYRGRDSEVASVVFDEFGSDDEDVKFDTAPKYDEQAANFYFPSPGRTSPSLHVADDDQSPVFQGSESPEKSSSLLHFSSERPSSPLSVGGSKSDNFPSVTFDDSDGIDSGSEGESKQSSSSRKDSGELSYKQNQSHGSGKSLVFDKEISSSETNPWLSSSANDSGTTDMLRKKNRTTGVNTDTLERFDYGGSSTGRSSIRTGKETSSESDDMNSMNEDKHIRSSQPKLSVHGIRDSTDSPNSRGVWREDVDGPNESSSGHSNEINFGKLTGGFRQKGYVPPPYTRSSLNDVSSLSNESTKSPTMISQTAPSGAVEGYVSSGVSQRSKKERNPGMSILQSVSDTDSSEEEDFSQQPSNRKQEPRTENGGQAIKANSSFKGQVAFFDSDGSDLEIDSPKQTFTGRTRPGAGFSRRTKATPSRSQTNSHSTIQPKPENLKDSATFEKSKPTKQTNSAGVQQEPRSQTKKWSLGQGGSSEQPKQVKATSTLMSDSNISLNRDGRKSSSSEQASSSQQKTKVSGNDDKPKGSTLSGKSFNREDSMNKASHVHPKLPDYDTIAAQLESLRMNRK